AWHKYREWDLGTLILVAEDSPLVTEIVDPQTGAIVARETVDGEHQFLLSSGTYQVRFAKKGDFSQTIDITLSPGTAGLRHTLRPNNHWIFKQQLIALGVTPLEGRGRGLLHWTNGGVELQRQGEASQLIPLSRFDSSYDPIADSLGFRWPPSAARVYGAPPYRLAGRSPWVHTQGIDFDSDGALDILCAGRH